MTQRPFSRPGAIDLSALKRPAGAPTGAAPSGTPSGAAGSGAGAAGASSYAVTVTEQNFQEIIESSMSAPVLLVFFSRSRMPESGDLADDLVTVSAEFEGRFLAGLVDIDATPAIAQAMQIPSIPLVVAVVDGRPAPLFQDVVPLAELRNGLTQVMQQLTVQGITGRHQPRHVEAPGADGEEAAVDPRYAAADAAIRAWISDAPLPARERAMELLHMVRLDFFQFNHRLHPKFDGSVKESARREVYETLRLVLRDNLPLGSLLKGPSALNDPFVDSLLLL